MVHLQDDMMSVQICSICKKHYCVSRRVDEIIDD